MNKDEKKTVVLNFRKELEAFISSVTNLQQDGRLWMQQEFLEKLADDVNSLYKSSIQVQKDHQSEIEEVGSIIQNIFVQPIALKHHEHLTILKAVQTYDPHSPAECDLSFIAREYVNHAASTKNFVIELELLRNDLDDALRHIA